MGRAEVRVEFEPRFCGNHVIDLTAGCSFGCIYCPFSDISARRRGAIAPERSPFPSRAAGRAAERLPEPRQRCVRSAGRQV